MADSKDTIYIDIDDEITGIIDKLRGSSGQVVALVLPKRAGVFQSIVNMKLLKRAADEANKNLVLITAEAGLLPLAGVAGVHVAKTLNSKPEIPSAPQPDDDSEEMVQETGEEPEVTADNAADTPVGELAGSAATDGVETLELDDDELPEDALASASKATKPKSFEPPAGKNKKLKVPDFNRFRLFLIIGGCVLAGLIIFYILSLTVLAKAKINIKTDATNVPTNLNVNLSTSDQSIDTDTNTVPAKLVSQPKTYTQQVPTTGQKNNGNKASGNLTNISAGACGPNIPAPISAGSGFSTTDGGVYITQSSISFNPTSDHGHCTFTGNDTSIVAQSPGTSHNVSGAPMSFSGVNGAGTANGGTDNIVHIVNQNDITTAKSKIATNDTTAKQALQNQLSQEGYFGIATTFSSGTPAVSSSPNVGQVADNVTVTEAVTYTMFGAHKNDLNQLVDIAVKNQVDTNKQKILSEGVDTAVFGVNTSSTTAAQLTMQATAVVGPDLDINGIKQSVAGKKAGDVKSQIQNNPDVTDVTVKFSPPWVSKVPKKLSKITVIVAKPTTTKASNPNANNP